MNAASFFLLYALEERERDRRLEIEHHLRKASARRVVPDSRRARRDRTRLFDLPVLSWLFGPLGQA